MAFSEVVPAVLAGERIDRAVAFLTGRPRAEAAELVGSGGVRVGGSPVTTRSRRLREGEVLEIDLPPARAEAGLAPDPTVTVPVLAADADVIVVDKPAGMVVHPGAGRRAGTLIQGLLARYPDLDDEALVAAQVRAPGYHGDPLRPGIVHRLDKGTSGLLVVARSPAAYRSLTDQLAARQVERRYLALVWGTVDEERGLIDAPLSRAAPDRTRMAVVAAGREARTRFEVLQRFSSPGRLSLVRCQLETGRTHQIRAHMAAIGHPVAGDERYRGAPVGRLHRPFLHAAKLGFTHPASGEWRSYDSPLPDDLASAQASLS